MKGLSHRREFFELSDILDTQNTFLNMSQTARIASAWAADQLGFEGSKREHYMRANVANLVRDNEVEKMISRIERDLFEANIDINREQIISQLDEALSTSELLLQDKEDD